MDIGEQFSLEHLLFKERTCRSCHKNKNLIEDFYMTRRSKRGLPSAYSYECKECTINRVKKTKKKKKKIPEWEYPDW